MYKLCSEKQLPQEVRDIAKKSFVFVKVYLSKSDQVIGLQPISPPWEDKTWDSALHARKNVKTLAKHKGKSGTWRQDLKNFLKLANT